MTARRLSAMAFVLVVGTGCGKSEPPPPTGTAGGSEARFGPLMMQIGRRLELSGRAARAGRWELATYEVEELREVYEGPLLDAPAPDEIHSRIEPFTESCLVPLEEAARARDMARFERELATTTTGCNACHQTAGVGFIEIPSEVGVEVPRIAPMDVVTPSETQPGEVIPLPEEAPTATP